MKRWQLLILGCLLASPTGFAKQELKLALSPEQANTEHVYLKIAADKDNKLIVTKSAEIPSAECDYKTKKVMISLIDLPTKEVRSLKCNTDGAIRPFYYLSDFLKVLKNKKVKKVYIEPTIIPYLHQSTPPSRDFAKILDKFLRKNELLEKSYIVSKSLKFLRVLKGQVNKEHKIIFKNGDSRPDYLHLALYYNLHGIMPHYQWIYDEDLVKIKQNDKRAVEVILWGEISPYIKQNLLKKQADGILSTQ